MKKVLVINNVPETLTFLSDLLTENDYEVVQARNSSEATEKLETEDPDLVCLDILLPEDSGLKLYHDMRHDEKLKGVPVVVVDDISSRSGGAGRYLEFERFIKKQSSVGLPEGYVTTPVDGDEFLAQVRKALA